MNLHSNNNYYAKFFKTTNGGLSIDSINTGFNMLITGLNIKNNTLLIYGNTGIPYVSGVFHSTNAGNNWVPSDLHKNVRDISYFDPSNLYATTPSGGGTQYLYKSTNNGLNWFNIGSDLIVFDIEFNSPSAGVGVGVNGGVYRTTNSGVNWIRNTSTFFSNYFWSVEFINSTTGFVGGSNSLFKTTNGGYNWVLIERIPGEQIEFTDVNTGYAVNYDTLYKTTNCGLNWINLNYGLYGQLNAVHFLNSNTGYILGKYNILKKTTDGGSTWTQITGYGGYYQECMYFVNENLGFIGREDYTLGWGVSRTTNGGVNWDFQSVPEYDYYIWDIFFINENTGFYTTANRIFRTTNKGDTWYLALNYYDLYNQYADINAIQFVNNYVGYAAVSGGKVLKSTDSGETWKLHNSITNYFLKDLSFTDLNTGYFVGFDGVILKTTNGCGDPIGIEPISSNIPESFELKQNYPNPFNPVTTIRFSIPPGANGRNEITTLKIYDILGKEISVPVNELLAPGEYEITWNAGDFPSGVYFCRLSSGNLNITRKLIFLK